MTEQIKSEYDVGNHVSWRSFCDIKAGTGKIFNVRLVKSTDCRYEFKYLVEYEDTEERIWVSEYDITYKMRKEYFNNEA